MSVYRPKKSPFYHYDFEYKGRRFSGSTGETSRRAAEQVETVKKAEAKATARVMAPKPAKAMTILEACDRYSQEVGQYQKRSDQVDWSLEYLVNFFGADTPIASITNNDVARMVAKRRGEQVENVMRSIALDKAKANPKRARRIKTAPKLVSPARVNRSVTEPLRKVLRRAALVWDEETGKIDWRQHMLKEPRERVREMSRDEEEPRIFAELAPEYHPIVRFILRIGTRAMEAIALEWPDVDWGNRQIILHGKGGKILPVPMPADVREILWPLQGRHPTRVFAYEDGRPMTYAGLDSAFGRAAQKAGIGNLRIHDLRHTAATRLMRTKGNLKLVQQLLRHEDITTTARYAHVTQDDLRAAMEDVFAAESPGKTPELPHADYNKAIKSTV